MQLSEERAKLIDELLDRIEKIQRAREALRAQADARPVAWCRRDTVMDWQGQLVNAAYMFPSPEGLKDPIPLYAHPEASAQRLSDEEIKAGAHRLWLLEGQGLSKLEHYEAELRAILARASAATVAEPRELEMLRADHRMVCAAGFYDTGELLDAYKKLQAAQQAGPVADWADVHKLMLDKGMDDAQARKAANVLFPRVTLGMVQQLRETQALLDQCSKWSDKQDADRQQAEPGEREINEIWTTQAEREAAQRSRMQERFANRPTTPATADFDLPAPNDAAQQQAEPESVIKRQAQKIGELIADRDSWIEAHARLYRLYHDQSPKAGEEIHVNVEGGDVYTLPLQLSGTDKPRFVVHVPCSEQAEPGADERAAFEAWYEADAMPSESNWFKRDSSDPTEYAWDLTQAAWEGWQAARAAQSGQRAGVVETAAARDVLAERQRQVSAEGWTPEHDDAHTPGTLSQAAGCYIDWNGWEAEYQTEGSRPINWPWDAKWWKPSDERRNLVKAGALILAEIERLDRAAAPTQQQEGGNAD